MAEEHHNGTLAFRPVRDRAFSDNILSLVRREKHGHGLAGLLFAEEIIQTLESVTYPSL
ncbi:hypothetical protein [Nonomuraea sp. NPDC052265]|uniref:hypothetical protein n=1 Tax=Nonomuraea sp. NPDC052265 TaxID=3364374 RepID=UPI0037C8030E